MDGEDGETWMSCGNLNRPAMLSFRNSSLPPLLPVFYAPFSDRCPTTNKQQKGWLHRCWFAAGMS